MKSRIIQISCAISKVVNGRGFTLTSTLVIALCEDGTVWEWSVTDDGRRRKWTQLKETE